MKTDIQNTINDFLEYFAKERLGLNQSIIETVLLEFKQALLQWRYLIQQSFLSEKMKAKYFALLEERIARLGLAS